MNETQTKPIRTFGADITETSLQQTLLNNGIDTFVRNLSFAEKRLVIVTAILNQTKESQNDWARTIESIANQMRVMDEQISRLGRAIGNVFMPILKTILPYLNAFLMVLVEVINWFAILIGYDPKEFDFFGETDKSVNDLADGLANANKQAEKLRSGLRGFDKLNVITSPSDSTSGGGAGTSIDPEILEMFNKTTDEYLNSLINVEMKATRIRDRIMDWLGFTKQIDPITGKVSFKYGGIEKTLKNFAKSFSDMTTTGKILVSLGLYVAGKNLITIITKLSKLLGVSGLLGTLKKLATPLLNIIQYTKIYTKLSGSLTQGIQSGLASWQSHLTKIQKVAIAIGGLAIGYSTLKDSIRGVTEESLGLETFMNSIIGYASNMIASIAVLGPTLGGIVGILISLGESLSLIYNTTKINTDIGSKYVETLNQVKEAQIESANSSLAEVENAKKLTDELMELIDAEGKIKEGKEARAKTILTILNEAYGTEYKLVGNNITQNGKLVTSYQNLERELDTMYQKKVKEIKLKAYEETYIQALKNQTKINKEIATQQEILEYNQERLNKAKETGRKIDGISAKEYEKSIERTKERIKSLEDSRKNAQQEILNYEKLLEVSLGNSSEAFDEALKKYENGSLVATDNIVNDIKKKWSKLGTFSIKTKVDLDTSNITPTLKNFWKSLSFSNLFKADGGILVNGQWQPVQQYASGGAPGVGQMFIARERGAELVGNIGGHTAVMNNDQIVNSVANGVYQAVKSANIGQQQGTQVYNIYLDEEHLIATYTLDELKEMSKSNGKPITI